MFQDKKAAEEYDKMLELAENITALIDKSLPSVNPEQSESIGLLLAKHRDVLARACKGRPDLLLEDLEEEEAKSDSNVTPLAAKK